MVIGILVSMGGIFNIINTDSTANQIIAFLSIAITVGGAVVLLIRNIYWFIKSYQVKRLLGGNDVVVHIPSREFDRLKPLVAVEDYNTYEKLRGVLQGKRIKTNLKYIPTSGTVELDSKKPNIVICGPKNSYMTKEAFETLEGIDFVKADDWFFICTDKEYHSPLTKPTEQYAFLGKIPYGELENVLLICGIHAIGSDGVSYFLESEKNLFSLLKEIKRSSFYCLIKSSYSEKDKKIYRAELLKETIKKNV